MTEKQSHVALRHTNPVGTFDTMSLFDQNQRCGCSAPAPVQQKTWSGTAWVPSSTQTTVSSFRSNWNHSQTPGGNHHRQDWERHSNRQYGFVQQGTQSGGLPSGPSGSPNLSATYTEYYHAYHKQEKDWESHLNSPDPTLRAQASQQCEWAKYQAVECSRAAHYFHQVRLDDQLCFGLHQPQMLKFCSFSFPESSSEGGSVFLAPSSSSTTTCATIWV